MNLHLKTSFDNIKRAPFQATAAILVLAVTFFVSTLVSISVFSSHQLLRYFESRPQIIAFLTDDVTAEQVDEFMGRLEEDPRVANLRFVSKEEALKIYKEATADNPLLGELVSPSIFPASVEFSPSNLDEAQELIDLMSDELIVDDIGFTASVGGSSAVSEVIERLKTVTYYVRVAGALAIGVLAATSFLVLMVVIGMRISMKRDEIDSLSLIGATPGFIRTPLMLEAIHYSIIGVFVGWLLAVVLTMYASPKIFSYFGDIPVLPKESGQFFGLLGLILVGELVVGIFIAILGSLFSLSRTLKLR
jgi:cell division transport system permease protein